MGETGVKGRARRHCRGRADPRDFSTYDGTRFMGRVVFLGDDWRAEDAAGHSLGLFATRNDAREAISEAGRAVR